MLDGMRKAAQGAIGRFVMTIVMGLIIVSFVVWGVGDMFRGFTSRQGRQGRRDLDHVAAIPERIADPSFISISASCASR